MRFKKEPMYMHGNTSKMAVVLVNLGTPEEPTGKSVGSYLREFLSDPRMVEIPKFLWWLILNLIIIPFRSKKSAKKYASIWTENGSPLKIHTELQTDLLRKALLNKGHDIQVLFAMRYGYPSMPEVLNKVKELGCDKLLILPAYPQYSGPTTASIFDSVFMFYSKIRNIPELRLIKHYHDNPDYIDALKNLVVTHWKKNGRPEKLIFSFHGVPKNTLLKGDPYHCECHKTARLLGKELNLNEQDYIVTFQSRFGKAEWLKPYTAPTLKTLASKGINRVDVMCPGFTSDCLETLEEISLEARDDFLNSGGKEFYYINCLNEDEKWIEALVQLVETNTFGWKTKKSEVEKQKILNESKLSRSHALKLGAIN